MKIRIKFKPEQKLPLYLFLPNGLFLNSVTAIFMTKAFADVGIEITPAQARLLVKSLKRTLHSCKRKFSGLQLMEAQSHTGEGIQIRL